MFFDFIFITMAVCAFRVANFFSTTSQLNGNANFAIVELNCSCSCFWRFVPFILSMMPVIFYRFFVFQASNELKNVAQKLKTINQ